MHVLKLGIVIANILFTAMPAMASEKMVLLAVIRPVSKEYERYEAFVRRAVLRNWTRAADCYRNSKWNQFRISINAKGRILTVHLQKSSGDPRCDEQALKAIYKTEPLPKPPPGLKDEVLRKGLILELK